MSRERLWTEVRGAGDPLLVLLHGLFATAGVWEPLDSILATSWPGRRLLIDLPGHGRSNALPEYSFGVVAAEVARAIGPIARPTLIVGHSMGGVVALTLATGWFGVPVAGAIAIGVKLDWSTDELAAAERARDRPAKWYDSREEAEERFMRLAGLPPETASEPNLLAGGIATAGERFRVAADPRVASIGPPPMAGLAAVAAAPVRLAAGELDRMVSVDQLRKFDPEAVEIGGSGHNAHIENATALAALISAVEQRPPARPDHMLSDS
jgi:pimeloyl-ACP methyl ester carboxylesterase